MKKVLAIILAIIIMLPAGVLAQTEYNWQNGEYTLGESGFKLVLPSGMAPVAPYPGELAAAMTKSSTPPECMGIVVISSTADPYTAAKQQYDLVLSVGSDETKPENIYANEKSGNALAEWTATFSTNKVTEYAEMGNVNIAGAEMPYILRFTKQKTGGVFQGVGMFMVPGKTQCYPIYVQRLFAMEGKATTEQVEAYREMFLGSLDGMLVPTGAGSVGLEQSQRGDGIPLLDASKYSDQDRTLAQIYNDTVQQIMDDPSGAIGTGSMYEADASDGDSVLRSSVLQFSNEYASRGGKWHCDRENTAETLEYFWDYTVRETENQKAMDMASPTTDMDLVMSGEVKPVELLTQINPSVDAVLFGLQDGQGRWVEDHIYMLVRVMSDDNTLLCLVTDLDTIAAYLASIGRDIAVIKPQVTVDHTADAVEFRHISASSQEWLCWMEEYNRIVDMMAVNGCLVSGDDQFAFTYAPQVDATMLHPVVMVLTNETDAAEMSFDAMVKDWSRMFEIVLQHAEDQTILPMDKELFFRLTEGTASTEPLYYAQGEAEYLVFMVTDSDTQEPLEDHLYALLRVLSPEGTANLSLITDQEMIIRAVQQSLGKDNAANRLLMSSTILPQSGSAFYPAQNSSRQWTEQEYQKMLDETAEELLHDVSSDSYFRSAISNVLSMKDNWLHNASKKTYDFLTDPFDFVLNGADEVMGRVTVESMSEDLMVEILREMLSGLESGVERNNTDNLIDGVVVLAESVAMVGGQYEDLEPIIDFMEHMNDCLDGAHDYLGVAVDLDAEYRQLAEIGYTTARYTMILQSIREACQGETFIVNACDRVLQNISDQIEKKESFLKEKEQDFLERAYAKEMIKQGLDELIYELAGEAGAGAFGAVLLGSDIGAFLTNQSAVLSEKEDLLVQLAYVNSKVAALTERSLETEQAYPMLELLAAVKRRGLYEADLYYTAYSNTCNGLWNTIFNQFDIREVKDNILQQRTSIGNRMDQLRREYSLLNRKR